MSIYTNVFRYRPRQHRSPKEDFLTAALADLLNRLPTKNTIEFVAEVLLNTPAERQAWHAFTESLSHASFEWLTQVRVNHINNGILDLLLIVNGHEAIVVENKIAAPVGCHENDVESNESDDDSDGESPAIGEADANQLRTYGHWLAGRCQGQSWPGALILLTYRTAPPRDFGGSSARNYGVPVIQVCRWSAIWRWAKQNGVAASELSFHDLTALWRRLCFEMAEFLEEENMTSEFMTLHDVAALETFIGSASRVERTFDEVKTAVAQIKNAFLEYGIATGNTRGPFYVGDGGVLWSWFYLKFPQQKGPYDWFFGWGIRFPAVSEWWKESGEALPALPHVFLTLSSDNSELPLSTIESSSLATGWIRLDDDNELVVVKPVHELGHDAEQFAKEFGQWVVLNIKTAIPLVVKFNDAHAQTK